MKLMNAMLSFAITAYLSLHDTYMTGTLPSEVGLWTSLSELVLPDVWLARLPIQTPRTNLSAYNLHFCMEATLSLSINALTQTIPSEIELLTNLGESRRSSA